MSVISHIKNHLKNVRGWPIARKIVCLAIDDFGNIRLSRKKALEAFNGIQRVSLSRFDRLDALDNRDDYEQLFEVLSSVNDKNGNPAIITAYAVPCNVNFRETLRSGKYQPENLDETYARLSISDPEHYEGALEMLRFGIRSNLLRPQFHGREHINVEVFNAHLSEKHPLILANLLSESLIGLPNHKQYPNVRFTESFGFWDSEDMEKHKQIILDGLLRFEKVYGIEPKTFTPPGMKVHPGLYPFLEKQGIVAIDKPRSVLQHIGQGKYQKDINITGIKKGQKHVTIVRNCVFEPNSSDIDWVNYTLNQINAAFFWNKPAIISSHRVNFCGHIDPDNRKKGLSALRSLLTKIVKTWPNVEFLAIDELAAEILKTNIE